MQEEITYLTQKEVIRFLSKIHDRRDRALFNLMYDFGLRASEVSKLRIRDDELKRDCIWITHMKGGVSAEYPIFRCAIETFETQLGSQHPNERTSRSCSQRQNPAGDSFPLLQTGCAVSLSMFDKRSLSDTRFGPLNPKLELHHG